MGGIYGKNATHIYDLLSFAMFAVTASQINEVRRELIDYRTDVVAWCISARVIECWPSVRCLPLAACVFGWLAGWLVIWHVDALNACRSPD